MRISKKESNREVIASFSMKFVIIATLVLAIYVKQWIWVIGSIIAILIGFVPTLLKRNIKFTLPWSIELLIASVFGLNMIGNLLNAYSTIPAFIAITQILFSILVAFFAFAIIYILHVYWDGLIMDKYAMAFLVVVTTMASAVVLEFIKWFQIFGRKQTSVEGVLTCLLVSTVFGIITALVGVSLIKKGTLDNITKDLGEEIDSKIIHRKNYLEKDWKKVLTDEQYKILREKGTEPAFTGKYVDNKKDGTYVCAGCGNALFSSKTKFDSGSGWPSFWDAISEGSVDLKSDNSLGMRRVEVVCSKCGGHLGHVFDDGPEPTGKRFCINSLSLNFKEKK